MAFDYPGEKLKNCRSNLETQTHVLVVRVEINYTNPSLRTQAIVTSKNI
jgi:hypothetical protein